MLVQYRVQNFLSFNNEQTLSMLASTSTKENHHRSNVVDVNALGIGSLVKSVAIFGANASGKSNLFRSLAVFKHLVLGALTSISSERIGFSIPFILKENYYDVPTEFEVTFLKEDKLYRYGIALDDGIIVEEWLYWTSESRETMLFHREKQEVKINQRSFPEARLFVSKVLDTFHVEKTKPTVPFISVLSSFDGEKSNQVVEWFRNFYVLSGISDDGYKGFTTSLFQKDPEFKTWALDVLKSVQIHDVEIVEEEAKTSVPFLAGANVSIAASGMEAPIKGKKINIVKASAGGDHYEVPFDLESEGTKKLFYLLGPWYNSIKNKEVLFIDEFDSKFHTLLSEFIIKLYHEKNTQGSQLLLTCHDTNLLDKKIFRRDQIWFVEKNAEQESELFSLLEYKEHYTRKGDSYSKDYLAGKYGAIPLFSTSQLLDEVCDGEG
ncbi:ATP/GTP-binding protein [Pseudomonas cichorii]|nr:ATP-binding protein [Pseudomonas cichorii]